jgi:hypothetical protein
LRGINESMKFLCLAYEEEKKFHDMSRSEWDALRKETLAYVDRLRKDGCTRVASSAWA